MSFIDKYYEYARDNFVPDKFWYWSGISAVAAALERKVFVRGPSFTTYPNIFVLLVGSPGDGKSTALNKCRSLLRDVQENPIRVLPEQMTQAKFIDLLTTPQTLEIPGTSKILYHSSVYLSFSEASNSALENIHGSFVNTITDFYDCPPVWGRATMKHGEHELKNVCVNLLAGCTFSYLSDLVNAKSIMGGFASRALYVAQVDGFERNVSFESSFGDTANSAKDKMREELLVDLDRIHSLKGAYRFTPEAKKVWEKWFNENDKRKRELESEIMQSLLARKSTNVLKLAMIVSASEGNSMEITPEHWYKAVDLADATQKDIAQMFMKSKALQTDTQEGINNLIYRLVNSKKLREKKLRGLLIRNKVKPVEADATLRGMKEAGIIETDRNGYVYLTINPEEQL